jgi:hypothetical protein
MTNPRQDKWQPIHSPKSVPVHWVFDEPNYNKTLEGVEAHSMEQKWDIAFIDGVLHFYRSWTGFEVYSFKFEKNGNVYTISSFEIEQDSIRYRRSSDEDEVEQLSLILKHVIGVEVHGA